MDSTTVLAEATAAGFTCHALTICYGQRHSHEHTEQLMVILDGSVTITVGDETKTVSAGDVVCINRGIEHELISEGGVTFIEGLAPVPLDHVPDRDRDLVLACRSGVALHGDDR